MLKPKHLYLAAIPVVMLLLADLMLLTDNPIRDYAQQKYLALRARVAELGPHPTPLPFMPTPLDIADTLTMQPITPTQALPARQSNATGLPTFTPASSPTSRPTATDVPAPPTPSVNLTPIQPSVLISGVEQEYQGWNNCGPTTLKMLLTYYGKNVTQKEIAAFTKPDPDDKNVSPNELAAYVDTTGMGVLVRENGTLERVDTHWRAFNRLYLIVYPNEKEEVVRAIVGDEIDDATMYTRSVAQARAEIDANPQDAFAYYNLGTSLNGLMQYKEAAAAFDKARVIGLPWRMMWYQFGPYVAYLNTQRDDGVMMLADATLHIVDDLEESHYYKGLALRALGRGKEARQEFETALRYNKNDLEAQQALQASVD